MPRNVRNFWIEADIDGRATTLEGGPQSREGGISLRIFVRESGSVTRAVDIRGHVNREGEITLDVSPARGLAERHAEGCGFTITTER